MHAAFSLKASLNEYNSKNVNCWPMATISRCQMKSYPINFWAWRFFGHMVKRLNLIVSTETIE